MVSTQRNKIFLRLQYSERFSNILHMCQVALVVSDSAIPGSSVHGGSPSKNTAVGCHALLQGIFPTQGSNPCLLCLLHWQAGSLPRAPPGKPHPHPAAAAGAKFLQSCPTLCDPIDSSPPGSPVPGILQARTLEWVAISLSNA